MIRGQIATAIQEVGVVIKPLLVGLFFGLVVGIRVNSTVGYVTGIIAGIFTLVAVTTPRRSTHT